MRVTLTTLTFDPLGVVALDVLPDQTYGESRRRMNRVPTLDGGAVFNDFGYTEADRTLALRWLVQSAQAETNVERLLQLYARVHVATPRGFYLCALESYTPGNTESSLSLLVVAKLA